MTTTPFPGHAGPVATNVHADLVQAATGPRFTAPFRMCYHPNATVGGEGMTYTRTCPDCPAFATGFGQYPPLMEPWVLEPDEPVRYDEG